MKIFRRTHAPCCVDTTPRHALREFDDQCEVRTLATSDALQVHCQYVLRPISLRMIEQWLRTHECFFFEIQRKDEPVIPANIAGHQHKIGTLEGLAANDRLGDSFANRPLQSCFIGNAAVEPEL